MSAGKERIARHVKAGRVATIADAPDILTRTTSATVVQTPDGFFSARPRRARGANVQRPAAVTCRTRTHTCTCPPCPVVVGVSTRGTAPYPARPLVSRSTYRQWNPFSRMHERRVCWRFRLEDGRAYAGRNSGEGMLLKARRVRTRKVSARARLFGQVSA